jgi:serralysin
VKNVENLVGTANEDFLAGDAGDNVITGGRGADRLAGHGGNDTFVWGYTSGSSIANSDFGATDIILDFTNDKIDVSSLAPFASAQPFIGSAAFTGTVPSGNEWRFEVSGGDTKVQADFNGDKFADFTIILQGYTGGLTADNFIF